MCYNTKQTRKEAELEKRFQAKVAIGETIIPQEEMSEASHQMEEETVEGIEKQFGDVVHYNEEKVQVAPKQSKIKKQEISSDSNEPRLISSRGSSRMLFADLNVEDLE